MILQTSLTFEFGVLALDAMLLGVLERSFFVLCLSVLFSRGEDLSPLAVGETGS